MYSDFDEVLNRKIKKVSYNSNSLTFFLEDGTNVSYRAVGDCCSSSYIEDLDNPEVFKDAILLSVNDECGQTKDSEEDDSYGTVLKWTFYKFKTDKGMCTLSFRNESNGYYNGWLEKER